MKMTNEQIAEDIKNSLCKYAEREKISWENLTVSMADCIAPAFALTDANGNAYKTTSFIKDVREGKFVFNRYKRTVLSINNDEVYVIVSTMSNEPAWQRIIKKLEEQSLLIK